MCVLQCLKFLHTYFLEEGEWSIGEIPPKEMEMKKLCYPMNT